MPRAIAIVAFLTSCAAPPDQATNSEPEPQDRRDSGDSMAAAGDRRPLEWEFKAGRVLRYKYTLRQEIGSGWRQIQEELSLILRLEVQKVDAKGVAAIRATCERVLYRPAFMETSYDSETDAELPEYGDAAALAAFKDKPVQFSMTSRGEIVSFAGCATELVRILPKEGDFILRVLGDETLESLLQQNLGVLPNKAVAEGDQWEFATRYRQAIFGRGHQDWRQDVVCNRLIKLGAKDQYRCSEFRHKEGYAVISCETDFDIRSSYEEDRKAADIDFAESKAVFKWSIHHGVMESAEREVTVDKRFHFVAGVVTKTEFKRMK